MTEPEPAASAGVENGLLGLSRSVNDVLLRSGGCALGSSKLMMLPSMLTSDGSGGRGLVGLIRPPPPWTDPLLPRDSSDKLSSAFKSTVAEASKTGWLGSILGRLADLALFNRTDAAFLWAA